MKYLNGMGKCGVRGYLWHFKRLTICALICVLVARTLIAAESATVSTESGVPLMTKTETPIAGCSGGKKNVLGFPFQDPAFKARFDLLVVSDGFKTQYEAVESLKAKGFKVLALVNGGFFQVGGSGDRSIYSYYKSTFFKDEHFGNSVHSPRACMVFGRLENTKLAQSTAEQFATFRASENTEIWCAGPQLVESSKSVAVEQFCSEKFNPKCRADGSDPGIGLYSSVPRTGSCVTAAGELKFFSFNSNVARCGATLPMMAQAMLDEGCAQGMNHDGGGSAGLYFNLPGYQVGFMPAFSNSAVRRVPVWIAVVEKNSSHL